MRSAVRRSLGDKHGHLGGRISRRIRLGSGGKTGENIRESGRNIRRENPLGTIGGSVRRENIRRENPAGIRREIGREGRSGRLEVRSMCRLCSFARATCWPFWREKTRGPFGGKIRAGFFCKKIRAGLFGGTIRKGRFGGKIRAGPFLAYPPASSFSRQFCRALVTFAGVARKGEPAAADGAPFGADSGAHFVALFHADFAGAGAGAAATDTAGDGTSLLCGDPRTPRETATLRTWCD